MCARRLSFSVVLCCFLVASLHSEQWFQISETELARLETISQNWETDRQSLLLQVSALKRTAEKLGLDSKTLNEQLKAERNTRTNLQKSFEQSETDRLKLASRYETEIADLKTQVAERTIDNLKSKNQRNVLLFVCIGLIAVFIAGIKAKLIKLFYT